MATRNSRFLIALALLPILLLALLAAAPVPSENAIPARVESTLSAPAGQETMRMPTDVALDSQGNVFIADGANARIVRFNARGDFLAPFKPAVSAPTGLFIDHKDRLWVADSGNHRVLQLSAEGNIEQTFDLPPDGNHPSKPTHLLLTSDDSRLYVVDNPNHRLLIRDQKIGHWRFAGGPGKSLGEFQYPFMIAQGKEGALHITETIGTRIQTLMPDGQWAAPISGWGIALGQLCRPKGIAVDAKGRIFVSDSTLRAVQVFSPAGKLEGVLTDNKNEVLRFDHPMGMRFDVGGRLYIVELKANRVAIVTLAGRAGGAP